MRIVHVASEVAPWASTGGLADVVAALPPAVAALSSDIRAATVAPLYRAVRARLAAAGAGLGEGVAREVVLGEHRIAVVVRPVISEPRTGRAGTWLVECPSLYDRDGLYGDGGHDHLDNGLRFAVLARAALDAAPELLGGTPDVVHAHDWQAGLAPLWARLEWPAAATVFTVHNLAYRGLFPPATVADLGLPWSIFDHQHAEFWDQLSFLKCGMAYADVVTTVSPTYAREILSAERGEGLDGFLRHDVTRVVGIVNGIDTAAWDPATDGALPARFRIGDLTGKTVCRRRLAAELGLAVDDATPLMVAVARLTHQKGVDLLADLVPRLYQLGARLAVLGAGDAALVDRLRYLAGAFRDHLAVRIGFDPALARRLYAGGDLFVMPSRFEPCGLGQLYAMRYGTVPVVAAVGGLRDTVVDPGDAELAAGRGTGFRFEPVEVEPLFAALSRAVSLFRDDPAGFARVRAAGMARDSGWAGSARDYLQVYRAALRDRR